MDTTQVVPNRIAATQLPADRPSAEYSTLDRSETQHPEHSTSEYSTLDQWMRQAKVMTEEGDYFTAVDLYDQIINLCPEYAFAYGERALLRANLLGDPQGAFSDLRQAASLFLAQGKTVSYEMVMNYMRSMQHAL